MNWLDDQEFIFKEATLQELHTKMDACLSEHFKMGMRIVERSFENRQDGWHGLLILDRPCVPVHDGKTARCPKCDRVCTAHHASTGALWAYSCGDCTTIYRPEEVKQKDKVPIGRTYAYATTRTIDPKDGKWIHDEPVCRKCHGPVSCGNNPVKSFMGYLSTTPVICLNCGERMQLKECSNWPKEPQGAFIFVYKDAEGIIHPSEPPQPEEVKYRLWEVVRRINELTSAPGVFAKADDDPEPDEELEEAPAPPKKVCICESDPHKTYCPMYEE